MPSEPPASAFAVEAKSANGKLVSLVALPDALQECQDDDRGELRLPRWLVARLCTAALASGFAIEGAEDFVRLHAATFAHPAAHARRPPRLRVYTLGRFSLVSEGRPLSFHGKVPHKPIELLQALIALGGRDLRAEQLMGNVWPDEDSADLRNLFDNTLHRLRRMLDCAEAIVLREGRLTLNSEVCWVDAWTFERLAGEHAVGPTPDLASQALHLYQGSFLQREAPQSWAFGYRERLRRRFHRLVLIEGGRLEAEGRWSDAAAVYERGLEADPLAEDLYRQLMACHAGRGAYAEALRTYQRCRDQLTAAFGVRPATATEAVRTAILRAEHRSAA